MVLPLSSSPLSRLIFLGSGSSTGIPTPFCLMREFIEKSDVPPQDSSRSDIADAPRDSSRSPEGSDGVSSRSPESTDAPQAASTSSRRPRCKVCHSAVSKPPHESKNYRCNPSLLIEYGRRNGDGNLVKKHILIDVGKTFREAAVRWFPRHRIPGIDSIVITHDHADASFGLDDVRGVQNRHANTPTTVHCSRECLAILVKRFDYLTRGVDPMLLSASVSALASEGAAHAQWKVGAEVRRKIGDMTAEIMQWFPNAAKGDLQPPAPMSRSLPPDDRGVAPSSGEGQSEGAALHRSTGSAETAERKERNGSNSTGSGENPAKKEYRAVSTLDWHTFRPFVPFDLHGLKITPLPVFHGEDYISYGFEFGGDDRVVYLSDVSRVPVETMDYILQSPVSILVVDSLFRFDKTHNTHFWYEESLALVAAVKPKRAFFIGMSHTYEHDEANAALRERCAAEPYTAELSYDGLSLAVAL